MDPGSGSVAARESTPECSSDVPKQVLQTPAPKPIGDREPVDSTPAQKATTNGPPGGLPTGHEITEILKAELSPCTATLPYIPGEDWNASLFKSLGIEDEDSDGTIRNCVDDSSLNKEHTEGCCWETIPIIPSGENDSLYDPIIQHFNKAFDCLKRRGKFKGERLALKTARVEQIHEETERPTTSKGHRITSKPDILIVGQDDRFLPFPINTRSTAYEFPRTIVVGDVKLDPKTKEPKGSNTTSRPDKAKTKKQQLLAEEKAAKAAARKAHAPTNQIDRAQLVGYAR